MRGGGQTTSVGAQAAVEEWLEDTWFLQLVEGPKGPQLHAVDAVVTGVPLGGRLGASMQVLADLLYLRTCCCSYLVTRAFLLIYCVCFPFAFLLVSPAML